MMLEYSVDKFLKHSNYVIVVCHPDWVDLVEDVYLDHPRLRIIDGGNSRDNSIHRGVVKIGDEYDYVFVHDAARPGVSETDIRKLRGMAYNSVMSKDKCKLFLLTSSPRGSLIDLREMQLSERSRHVEIHTPELVERKTLEEAYNTDRYYRTTYEPYATVFERCMSEDVIFPDNVKVYPEGGLANFKVTLPQDIFLAEHVLTNDDLAPTEPEIKGEPFFLKNALVFGASGGIGSNVVRKLEEYGATVDTPTHEEIDLELMNSFWKLEKNKYDIIVHSAGDMITKPFAETDLVNFYGSMSLHYMSAISILKYAEDHLRRPGHVVFLGSSAAMKGRPGLSSYSPAKAALENLVQSVGEEFRQKDIYVNCVSPTRTDTALRVGANDPDSSLLSPETVAHAVRDLCIGTYHSGLIKKVRLENE
jgi:2-C-methyl-D-erythritol 4-phosphate cytidylyltransferase